MKMKLLTKKLLREIPPLYSQEGGNTYDENPDPIVRVKFFTPDSFWTWYATEGSGVRIREDGEETYCALAELAKASNPLLVVDDIRFFGLCVGFEPELGYFSFKEISTVTGPMGLNVERDLYWRPRPLSEVKEYKQITVEPPHVLAVEPGVLAVIADALPPPKDPMKLGVIRGSRVNRLVYIGDQELTPTASQRVFNHSPDGFNWGYGGSGAAQFALGVMLYFLPEDQALRVHQDFKWDVVANLPDTFEIPIQTVKDWIQAKGL
ncbi:MAG: DUF6166 domain-containing protein [Candidatus Eisenbacteria bacterium]